MTSRSRRWNGNDLDTYADDLATLVKMLDLKNAIHFLCAKSSS
jgi:non-heme chloroperoxidase